MIMNVNDTMIMIIYENAADSDNKTMTNCWVVNAPCHRTYTRG